MRSSTVKPYPFKTRPYNYQRKALRFLWGNSWGGGLLMEPGTGKTKVALDFIGALYLNKGVRRVLVVCPIAAFGVWEEQAKEHMSPEVPYTHIRINKSKTLSRLHDEIPPEHLQLVVINYESARLPIVLKQLLFWEPDVVILDESHKIKKPAAKRSKACHRLGRVARYRLVLTGTAITNSPLDIFSQWKFLNPQRFGYSFNEFKQEYAIFGGYGGYSVLGYKNTKYLQGRMARDAFVALKEDCLDLPEKIHQIVPIQLKASTSKLYYQMERQMIAELDEQTRIVAPIVLTKLLRLAQITSGFISDEGKIEAISTEKLDMLEDLLETYCIEPQRRVAIFCRFIPTLERIQKRLQEMDLSHSIIRGGMSIEKRAEARQQLWSAKGPAVILGQIEAIGLSIDLSCCSTGIFAELDYSADHYIQAQDRLHRLGQRNPVTYLYLQTPETVDEDIYWALQGHNRTAEDILSRIRYRVQPVAA